jgi:hypothetical protein
MGVKAHMDPCFTLISGRLIAFVVGIYVVSDNSETSVTPSLNSHC